MVSKRTYKRPLSCTGSRHLESIASDQSWSHYMDELICELNTVGFEPCYVCDSQFLLLDL